MDENPTLVTTTASPWSFDEAVAEAKPLVDALHTNRDALIPHLIAAHAVLCRPGRRTDRVPSGTRLHTWSEYLEAIGIPRSSADRMMREETQGPKVAGKQTKEKKAPDWKALANLLKKTWSMVNEVSMTEKDFERLWDVRCCMELAEERASGSFDEEAPEDADVEEDAEGIIVLEAQTTGYNLIREIWRPPFPIGVPYFETTFGMLLCALPPSK